jgi:TP901 family phage tail tape measure protein
MAKLKELDFQKSIMSKLGGIGQSFRQFGYGMYASITPAIMMAGRYAIQAARDTDAAYRDMRKTVNGTEQEFEQIKKQAVEFSQTHITSADQMLEMEALAGQLGVSIDNLKEFGETAANLDIATDINAEQIALQMGQITNVMSDLDENSVNRFADSLVRLGNNMPVMESDIMTLMTRFMGMGKVVGLSADQVLAWATAAVSTGQKAEAGGSAMIRFMSNMETAVTKGGDSLSKWASVAGMSAADFKQKFETDASGAMYSFIEGRIAALSTWHENPIHNTVEFELYAGPVFNNMRNWARVKVIGVASSSSSSASSSSE